MPGLRGEDEVLKAFADLEYKPGSRQKRRADSPTAQKRRAIAENDWDVNPVVKMLGGKETEVFTIGAMAKALEKSIISIRSWEKRGTYPVLHIVYVLRP